MKNITTKQFQLLSDNQTVWDLLVENYGENGVEAPFFEYALTSSWLDKRYLYPSLGPCICTANMFNGEPFLQPL